jgi:predicted helicase
VPAPFSYIYAVLYTPSYRVKYSEFLKNNFPKIPLPKDAKEFAGFAADYMATVTTYFMAVYYAEISTGL